MIMEKVKQECSLQNLITMDLDESAYRHCIEDVKSPFQILQLEKTSATEDLTQYKDAINRMGEGQSKNEVNSFVVENRKTQEYVDSRNVSQDRARKKIFEGREKSKSGFWPQLCSAVGSLIFQKSVQPTKPFHKPQNIKMDTNRNGTRIPENPQIPKERVFPPITYPPAPQKHQSLYFNGSNLPQYEQDFIEFVLKILPKLFLKSTIMSKIYAQKSQIIQAMLSRIENQDKYKTLLRLFRNDNVGRIDRRLKSQNLEQFLGELTDMSLTPIKAQQRTRIITATQRTMEILCEIEDDIRTYLSTGDRVEELERIYDHFIDIDPRPRKLITQVQSYLNRRDIICSEHELRPLSYIWRNMEHRFYIKQHFVEELTRNDYLLRDPNTDREDLLAELRRLGYQRNKP